MIDQTFLSNEKLASNLAARGLYSDAEPFYRRALEIFERVLGSDHRDTAAIISNLASNLFDQGRYPEAALLNERALDVRERVLGPDHPDTARSLNNLANVLRAQGRYAEAAALLERALDIYEREFGQDHPTTVLILSNLAAGFSLQGRYAEATPLFERALDTHERVLGPDHPDTAGSLNSLATHLTALGRYAEAVPLYERALEITERVLGLDHPDTALYLGNLAHAFSAQDRLAEAASLFERALDISERILGPDHPGTAASARNLAGNLAVQGRFSEAALLFERALDIREQVLGPDHPDTALSLVDLSGNLDKQGRFSEAVPLLERALGIRERVLGSDHPATVESFEARASNFYRQGRYDEAEVLFMRALDAGERGLGPDHPYIADILNALGGNLSAQGRYSDATERLERSLAVRRKVFGEDHRITAESLNNLALNFTARGLYVKAVALFERALDINERVLGRDHSDTAQSLNNLAVNLARQGRYAEAGPLLERALDIRERVLGADHVDTAQSLINLATILDQQGRGEEVMPLYERALDIHKRILGPDHPLTAHSLVSIAVQFVEQDRYAEAVPFLNRSLDIRERVLGPDHPDTAVSLTLLGFVFEEQGRYTEGIPLYERAFSIVMDAHGDVHPFTAKVAENLAISRLDSGSPQSALSPARLALRSRLALASREGASAATASRERLGAAAGDPAFILSRAAWEVADLGSADAALSPSALRSEAFEAAQSISSSGAAEALTRASARATSDAPGLSEIARDWDAALEARAALDRVFAEAAGAAGDAGEARRGALRDRRESLNGEITRLEDILKADFPAFFNLVRPEPVNLAALQAVSGDDAALLGDDEALVLMIPGRTIGDRSYTGLVFAVTKEGTAWAELGLEPEVLTEKITRLRALLDGQGSTRAAAGNVASDASSLRAYDRSLARELYEGLFGSPEIAALIGDKPDWVLAPQGALLSLPFAALVTGSYGGEDDDPSALRATPWLGLERSLAVVPSVPSLRSLRVLERPGRVAERAFFGLGSPAFEGGAGDERVGAARSYFRDARGDVEAVRQLARLPGTEREIVELARVLGADEGSYLLGSAASETNVRAGNADGRLSSARVVVFATHGLLAGDLSGTLAEPALALSPPVEAGDDDDGLLTASEAAGLRLSADWVILSACNTASGGDPDADGLTGLARAFFYAGADTLLVSHWRVRDDAAARLTTGAIGLARETPGLSRVQAYQASMRQLMQDTSKDTTPASFAHPAAWAPFAVIGVE